MRSWKFLVLLAGLILAGCGEDDVTPNNQFNSTDYELYSLYANERPDTQFVLAEESNNGLSRFFWDESSSGRRIQDIYRSNPSVDWNMLEDFQETVFDSLTFDDRFSADNISIISVEERDEIFSQSRPTEEWWPEFFNRYGENAKMYGFSRIAYNEGRNQGVFSSGYFDGVVGYGEFVFMVKENGTWRVEQIFSIWIT